MKMRYHLKNSARASPYQGWEEKWRDGRNRRKEDM